MDLTKVVIREMKYDGDVVFHPEVYKGTGILDLKNVHLNFSIEQDLNQDEVLTLHSTGAFLLEDARTLDPVEYPFEVSLHEKLTEESDLYARFLTNSQNTLDILSILWENIVLEIPISYTISEELKSDESKGYSIVGEESVEKIDPRLAPLMELLDKEKE